jgi:hypothetical protein
LLKLGVHSRRDVLKGMKGDKPVATTVSDADEWR